MLKIHKKVEYGLITIKHMLEQAPSSLFRAKDISQKFQIPFDATSRVLQILAANGYLLSIQGPKGGYKVLEKINSLDLLHLMEIIEGPQVVVKCLSAEGDCPISSDCSLASPMQTLNHRLIDFCRSINVVELVGATSQDSFQEMSFV